MAQLDAEYVPISGSTAAQRRKQQLQFQVPIHDLNAEFCHNLTENEAQQLVQYTDQIKNKCVGQGHVMRMLYPNANETTIAPFDTPTNKTKDHNAELNANIKGVLFDNKPIASNVIVDTILYQMINSDIIKPILNNSRRLNGLLCQDPQTMNYQKSDAITNENKSKLNQFNVDSNVICSSVQYGPVYDKIFSKLNERHISLVTNPLVHSISRLRTEYLNNDEFKENLDAFVTFDDCANVKDPNDEIILSAPLHSTEMQKKQGQFVNQDTPIRKVKTQLQVVPKVQATGGKPKMMDEKDLIISAIFKDDELNRIMAGGPSAVANKLIISSKPVVQDFNLPIWFMDENRNKLNKMGLNKMALESAVANGDLYDNLFAYLDELKTDYADCSILAPLKAFRAEYVKHEPFQKDVIRFLNNCNNQSFLEKINNPTTGVTVSATNLDDELIPLTNALDIGKHPPATPTKPVRCMQCKTCEKDIYAGTVAVKAERAGKNVAWHPQCFICKSCGELLADLVYFYHQGNIYCARDLAIILKIPRCFACDELIFTKEYTAAEGATFHIKHFCCYRCDNPLAGLQYVPDTVSNMPVCLKCYDEHYAMNCMKCMRGIKPDEQGVSWDGMHWHGPCFMCSAENCRKPLIGERFCIKKDLPFCSAKCIKNV